MATQGGRMIFHDLKRWLVYGASGWCIMFTTADLMGYPAQVEGRSMQPILNANCYNAKKKPQFGLWPMGNYLTDWVFISRRGLDVLAVGDIVTLNNPRVPADRDIKRIIATEGQTVVTRSYKNKVVVVPKGHVWIEGDNHSLSKDSNVYGPVPAGLIYGKAVAIVFPPDRIRRLDYQVPPRPFGKVSASSCKSHGDTIHETDDDSR